jgi:hypothetical protein
MGTMTATAPPRLSSLSRRLRVAVVVWLAMLGLDFLLNGALFARLYLEGGTFILAPAEAFQRIPLGYLAFLMLALSVVEIAYRLRVTRIDDGIRLGLVMGAVFGGTWSLSLYSIATLSAQIALSFALIWLALVTLAAAVAVSGLAQTSLRGLAFRVAVFDVLCAVTVIALQSFGVVPTVTS